MARGINRDTELIRLAWYEAVSDTGTLDEERTGTRETSVAGETAFKTILPALSEDEVISETGSLDEKQADLLTGLSDDESLTDGRTADGVEVGGWRTAARVIGSYSGSITA